MIKKIRSTSIETRLLLMLLFLAIFPAITVGWLVYSAKFEDARAERIRNVGTVSGAKYDQLVMVLTRANDRAKLFLANLRAQCDDTKLNPACAAKQLESYRTSENAQSAILYRNDGSSLATGAHVVWNRGNATFKNGQLAQFSGTGANNNSYFISVAEPFGGLQLVIYYPATNLHPIFAQPGGLGKSGETFLADGDGYFVTAAKYPSARGRDVPNQTGPMQACLSGKVGQVLGKNYRDKEVINGFHFVPELGSACIMAQIYQDEAFAPLKELKRGLTVSIAAFALLAMAIALYMAKSIARPIKQLTTLARAISNGDLTAQINVKGADEIVEMANSFNVMTRKMVDANAQLNQQIDQLKKADEYSRKLSEELRDLSASLQSSLESERKRIARELHDELGQSMTALRFDLKWLHENIDVQKKETHEKLQRIEGLVDKTVDAIRRISEDLRPGMLDDLGLAAAIESHVSKFSEQSGIDCDLSMNQMDFSLDPPVATALFRIVQEALTNVARHSGADHVVIQIQEIADNILLIVQDNGAGFPSIQNAGKKTYGLLGMRERVKMLGGTLDMFNEKGAGARIEVCVPKHAKGA